MCLGPDVANENDDASVDDRWFERFDFGVQVRRAPPGRRRHDLGNTTPA